MRRLSKVLSIALALCLLMTLMTLLPLQTFAANTADPLDGKQQDLLYASLRDSERYPQIQIEEIATEPDEAPAESGNLWESSKTYAPTYQTVENAALKLRENMKNRKTTFDLYVKSTDISNYNTMVDVLLMQATAHTGNPTEGDYLMWHIDQWGGEVATDMSGSWYLFHYTVEMSYYTTAAQEKELTTAVNALVKQLNVKNKSDYEKVKAVYDYICQNVTYDYEHLDDDNYTLMYSAYAALVNKTAVCQGYASLLYRLLLELDVDCRMITGVVLTGEPHAWNIVKLGDVYYNLDATWDAETEPDLFFLRNSVLNATHYRYLDYRSTQFHRDYPMSETDYVDGVDGKPEYYFEMGTCGDDAYWAIDRDGQLTIAGTGATYNYRNYNGHGLDEAAPWFYWLDGFHTVIVEEGITAVGNYLFATDIEPKNVVSVTLPESLTEIGEYAFRNCDNLTEIRIPDGVKTIGMSAFAGCDNLQTVVLGNALETIGMSAFENCELLQEINFPESLKNLGPSSFQGCDSLTEVTIPAGVSIARGFGSCVNLQTVYIDSRSIDAYAFSSCRNLHTVVLLENLTKIDSCAFEYCASLQQITIPKNVTQLGNHIFRRCTSLNQIYFEGDAPQFQYYTFDGVTATCYYPAGNETWTEEVRQNYKGTITWEPYCAEHSWVDATCTTPKTCSHCGVTEGDILEHNYENGQCTLCGERKLLEFAGMTLETGNSLGVNLVMKWNELPESCYAVITLAGKETVVWKSEKDHNGPYWRIPFAEINATQMMDQIQVVVYDADGKQISQVYTRTIEDYCLKQIRSASSSAKLKTLLVDMLNYGAAAQKFFAYNEENPANMHLTEEELALATQEITMVNDRVQGQNNIGSSLALRSNLELKFYYTNVSQASYAMVSYTNYAGQKISYEAEITVNGSHYIVTVNTLLMPDCSSLVSCELYDADGNVLDGTKSVDSAVSYCARQTKDTYLYEAVVKFATSAAKLFG